MSEEILSRPTYHHQKETMFRHKNRNRGKGRYFDTWGTKRDLRAALAKVEDERVREDMEQQRHLAEVEDAQGSNPCS